MTIPKTKKYLIQFVLTFTFTGLMCTMLNAALCREAVEAATFFKGADISLPKSNSTIDHCNGLWSCADRFCELSKTSELLLINVSTSCIVNSKLDIYFLYNMKTFSVVSWLLLSTILISFVTIIVSVLRALAINQDEFHLLEGDVSSWKVYGLSKRWGPHRVIAFYTPYILGKLACIIGFIVFFYANASIDDQIGDSPPTFVSFNDNLMYGSFLFVFIAEAVWSSVVLVPFFYSNFAEL